MIVVSAPGMPDARDKGISVAEGKIRKGVLLMTVVMASGMFGGDVGSWKVVDDGIIRKGVPLIIVVEASPVFAKFLQAVFVDVFDPA